jgi:hypothetical protein
MRQRSDALLVSEGRLSRCGGNSYTLVYGFGSIRSCAWDWNSFSCEDDGVGSGCGDVSEPLCGGKGEAECRGGLGFDWGFGFDGGFGFGWGFGFGCGFG